jgi:tetratricopeptide (TPR) repeat protein
MAPEQASGSATAVTTAADVYGLGAILYEMLTGRPPFRGVTPLDTVRLVIEQEPTRPSVHDPSVPRDLETICLKCLHKEPQRRYASARELADDLRRFLNGEPILARPVGPLERVWRMARRQPVVAALTLALAATFLIGVSGVIALWLHAEDSASQAKKHARTAEREAEEAKAAREDAEKHRRDAEQHFVEAERSFRMAHQAVHDYCRRVSEELRDTPSLQPLRKALLQDALTYYKSFLDRRGNDPTLRREQADTYQSMARVIHAIGSRAEARDAFEHALAIYRDLQRDAPDDFDLLRRLGGILNDSAPFQDKTDDVVTRLDEARVLYENYLAQPPEKRKNAKKDWDMRASLGLTLSNLGWAEQQRGRLGQARNWYRQARNIQEQLLKEKPKDRVLQSNLAATLSNYAALRGREFGGRDETVASLEEACRLREELARSGEPGARADLAAALQNLFNALRADGRHEEAKEVCKRAYDIREKLARDYPLVRRYQSDLAASHRMMGFLARADKRLEQALDHHQKARDIQKKQFDLDRSSPGLRRELSWSYFNIAAIHGALKDRRQEEFESYEEARKLQEGLVRLDPANLEYREDLVRTLNNLGWNRMAMNHPEEAPPLLREAIDHARLAVRRAGGIQSYRRMLTHALATLVEAELRLGHTNTATELLRERRKLWPSDPEEQFRVAHDLMATAARISDGKAELTPAERDERDANLKEALDALRQAVARGFRDAARLKNDKRFDPVRGNDMFRDLVRDLEKKTPGPKKQPSDPPESK